MKIGELAAAAGVSKQTIHFYLREGILRPPVQTSKNMAYYDSGHIEDIHLIKELQEKRYLPLAVIKLVLDAFHTGNELDAIDHIEPMNDLFNRAKGDFVADNLTMDELITVSGLSKGVIEELEAIGLVTPLNTQDGNIFDSFDAAIIKAMGRLLNLGLEISDIKIYAQILALYRAEATLVHNKVIHKTDSNHPSLRDINSAIGNAKRLLVAKAYREIVLQHQGGNQRQED
ncbi:MAG: MerR family transcriptional regulator [Chitinophagales bacterium]